MRAVQRRPIAKTILITEDIVPPINGKRTTYAESKARYGSDLRAIGRNYYQKYPEKARARYYAGVYLETSPGFDKHHWSYREEHFLSVIKLRPDLHKYLHKNLVYDQELLCYRRKDTSEILDTLEKHEEYIRIIIADLKEKESQSRVKRTLEVDDMRVISEPYRGKFNLLYVKMQCKVCGVIRDVPRTYLLKRVNSRHGQMCTKELIDGTKDFKPFCAIYGWVTKQSTNKFAHFRHFHEALYSEYLKILELGDRPKLIRVDPMIGYEPENCKFICASCAK